MTAFECIADMTQLCNSYKLQLKSHTIELIWCKMGLSLEYFD